MPMLTSTSATAHDTASQRQTMVDCQIRTFDVTDQTVLDQFLDTPREMYVPGALAPLAYSDAPLEIRSQEGETRCLLTPMVLARMVQGAGVKADDRVLDVAGGAGYTAAILAGLAKSVVSLEPIASLSALAAAQFSSAGLNATAVCGPLDASAGVDGVFDLIFVNGAVEEGLDPLLAKLAPGGRLVVIQRAAGDPTGNAAKATRYEKVGGELSRRVLFDASGALLGAFARRPIFVF
ncbi:MAG: Protein-L-isoaspartate(D-aspartate) O-methyltransferase [Hyphomicrobiales bacterium]|nr:Protein-L-isoaspartate(D-aspartate) O-methyltransferase [Hyphomicrobiales bacterium]